MDTATVPKGKLPFHEKLHLQLAAYLLRHPGAWLEHKEHLNPAYIRPQTVSHLMLLVSQYHEKYGKTPTENVLRELIRQAFPDINDQSQVQKRSVAERKVDELYAADISDHEFLSDQVRHNAVMSSLRELVIEIKDKIDDGELDHTMPERFRAALAVGESNINVGHNWRQDMDGRILEFANPEMNPRVPTGVQHLDPLMNGGLAKGELGLLLALPKHYKSGAMMNFAFEAMKTSNNLNVVYITLELAEELVGLRFDMRCALTSKEDIQTDPKAFLRKLKSRMGVQLGDANQLMIKEFKTKTATCDTIRAYLDHLYHKLDITPGMVIVDYLDLLKPTRKRDKSYEEATDICEDLRSVASKSEYHVPIWTACRATREAVGRKVINMAAMSKSFERVGACDIMISLCQTEEEKLKSEMRMYFAATRNDAGDKIVNCRIDYPKMMLYSVGTSEPTFDEDEDTDKWKGARRKKRDDEDEEPPDVPRGPSKGLTRGGVKKLGDEEREARQRFLRKA